MSHSPHWPTSLVMRVVSLLSSGKQATSGPISPQVTSPTGERESKGKTRASFANSSTPTATPLHTQERDSHEPDPDRSIIVQVSRERFVDNVEHYVDLYMAAMKYDSRLRASRIAAWEHDATLTGFVAFEAVDPAFPQSPIGICYGHNADEASWWHREIARGVMFRKPTALDAPRLLQTYFEVCEIHVKDSAQSHGIGRRLLRRLLSATNAPFALLSTPEVPGESNRAFSLYRSPEFGFQDLLRSFYFYGDYRPFAVLFAQLDTGAPGDPAARTTADTGPATRTRSTTEPDREVNSWRGAEPARRGTTGDTPAAGNH